LEQAVPPSSSLQLTFTCSVYETAVAIRDTEPDYVVLHASLPRKKRDELRHHIEDDPHCPNISVLVIGDEVEDETADGPSSREEGLERIQTEIWRLHRAMPRSTDRPATR